jgi:hypothetical protein
MWGKVDGIRTSTFILGLSYVLIAAACAKGTEISPSEIVVIEPLRPRGPDASADAGVAPAESAAEPAPGE